MSYYIPETTTYDNLIRYLAHYYGTESAGWQQLTQAGLTNQNIINEINSIPGHKAIQNADGTVRMYLETQEYGSTTDFGNVAQAINSNAQAGTNTGKSVTVIDAPAHTTYQNGTFKAASNVNANTGMQFISKSVVPAIAAAAVGIQLGKTIDSTLYNANPNFWDSNGMGAINPATWASITSDMSGSTGEQALSTAFNLLFGIDPEDNSTQMYIDETAYAYLALYLQQKGVFAAGNSYHPSEAVEQYTTGVITFNNPQSFDTIANALCSYSSKLAGLPIVYDENSQAASIASSCNYFLGDVSPTSLNAVVDAAVINYPQTFNNATILTGLSGKLLRSGTITTTYRLSINRSNIGTTQDPKYVAKVYASAQSSTTSLCAGTYINNNNTLTASNIGIVEISPIDGIGTQTGATLPQLNNDMSVNDVLQALQTQYPELWTNSITNTVAQPDGTTTTYTYVPMPFPQAVNVTDTQPTADGENINQTSTKYDPNTMVETVLSQLLRLINPNKSNFNDPGDNTGSGDTPTVILPTGSASALWKIYNPSQSQLNDFGSWLWSSDFVDQILKLFNDPMQAIIGLHKIFVTPPTSGSGSIKVGYLTSTAGAAYVSGQYVDLDCGTINLYEYFGGVFDYAPYTTLELFLPFIGFVQLDTADTMRGKISIKYHVDVLTGACLAEVKVIRDGAGGTLYTFSGNCAVQYPVSSGSYVGIVTGLLGIAGGVAGTILSGGSMAPALLGAGAAIGNMHSNVRHSGNLSANAGAMGSKKPYLVIQRPQTKMPDNGTTYEGLPQNKTVILENIRGYTIIKKAIYNGIPCTDTELKEIKSLLETGVYIN